MAQVEGPELGDLRRKTRRLHEEFSDKAQEWGNLVAVQSIDVTGALQKVLDLTQLVPALCHKDYAAYFQHLEQHPDTSTDTDLQVLKRAAQDAYLSIAAREGRFLKMQKAVMKMHEVLNDLIARAENLEANGEAIRRKAEMTKTMRQNIKEKRKKQAAKSKQEADEALATVSKREREIDEKYRVNKDIISGLADFFSRKDDHFNLALSLGIGEDEMRKSDQDQLESLRDMAQVHLKDLKAAEKEARGSDKVYDGICKTLERLAKSAQQTQEFKARAIDNAKQLAQRKTVLTTLASRLTDIENSMERFETTTSSLPTIAEMSAKILSVVVAAARYREFEAEVGPVNAQILAVLLQHNDWDSLSEEEDEDGILKLYAEAKSTIGTRI